MNMEYQQSLTKIVKKVVTLKKLRKVRQDYGKKSVIDEHQKKQKNKKKKKKKKTLIKKTKKKTKKKKKTEKLKT